MKARALLLAALLAPLAPLPARGADDGAVLLREEFATLDDWRPLTFPKVARHSRYAVEADPGIGAAYLRAESDASASGLVWKREYDIRAWPRLRWRWKVANLLEKGDASRKSGDDYPIRVYVIFRYDPATAPLGRRLRYGLARAAYGEYPPDSGLSYVWESRAHDAPWLRSAYTDSVAMVFKQQGAARVGEWVEEEADVLADYRAIFGRDPPRAASLAIMSDGDDTGGRATAWVDWIEVAR